MGITAQFITRRILRDEHTVFLAGHREAELFGRVGGGGRFEPRSTCTIVMRVGGDWSVGPGRVGRYAGCRDVAFVEPRDGVARPAMRIGGGIAEGIVDCAYARYVAGGDLDVVWVRCAV
jgi:hypothetical protein